MASWFTDLRSGATRFVRVDGARAVLSREDTPLILRAALFAITLTLVVLSLLIIVPLVAFAGIVFVASLGFLKIRRFFSGLWSRSLPRDDGRENVRVRLPAEQSE
jgi:hypothetical protein